MRLDRLRQLTAAELRWRAREAWRIVAERASAAVRAPRWDPPGNRWTERAAALRARLAAGGSRYALDPASLSRLRDAILARWPEAARESADAADRIVEGRYDLLGYRGLSFRDRDGRLDWHLDPVHRRRAPLAFWRNVPYLDPAIGDHKVIWELNRHQHWLRLGRAHLLTGRTAYARAIVSEFDSWLDANPPLVGINWASMLELGFRSLSWVWTIHCLSGDSGSEIRDQKHADHVPTDPQPLIPNPCLARMLAALDRQLTHVERHLSHYFSPNTHLTGEALALYVVGTALPEIPASRRWADVGRRILVAEIDRQVYADGGHAERSAHYQRYTLDFYLLAFLTARRAGDAAAAGRFGEAALRLAQFTRAIADDHGELPLIGDDDGGMLWPLTGRACRDVRDSLSLAAALFDRPDLAPWDETEEAWWIAYDSLSRRDPEPTTVPSMPQRLGASQLLPHTGYFVLRDGRGSHAVLDVGRHGYLNAGHAHADALALTLSLDGRPLLVDPGTATYTVNPGLRDRMRDTASHNTLVLDGRPQSIPAGPFHWKTQAHAVVHGHGHTAPFDWIEASHDGYAPSRHRRTVVRTREAGWLIADEVLGEARHAAAIAWHFHPAWHVEAIAPGTLRATHADGTVVWLLHDGDDATVVRDDYAPVYGALEPAWTARITRHADAPFAVLTWIGRSADMPALTRLPDSRLGVRVDHEHRTTAFVIDPGTGAPPRTWTMEPGPWNTHSGLAFAALKDRDALRPDVCE